MRQFVLEIANLRGVTESILNLVEDAFTRDTRSSKQYFFMQMRRRITRDPDMVQLLRTNSCSLEAISNRMARKTRGVLEPVEALFLGRRDQLPIANKRRRSVAVI